MGMIRQSLSKHSSAKHFRHNVSRTKAANIPSRHVIMRGGQRM